MFPLRAQPCPNGLSDVAREYPLGEPPIPPARGRSGAREKARLLFIDNEVNISAALRFARGAPADLFSDRQSLPAPRYPPQTEWTRAGTSPPAAHSPATQGRRPFIPHHPKRASAARFDPSSSCNKARRGVANLGRPTCQEGIIRALPHRTRGGRDAHADQDHTPTGLESARRQPRPHSGQASRPGCAIRAARPPGSSEFTYRYRSAQHTRNASRLDSILVTGQLTPAPLVTGQLRLVFNMAEISPALRTDDGRTHW